MIDYTWVSMGAMLRDFIEVRYANKEHQMLCDIADSLYNVGVDIDSFKDEYKKLYEKYGDAYFDKVIADMEAIDSQVTSTSKARELEEDYYDRVGNADFREDYYDKAPEIKLISFDPERTSEKAYRLFKESGLYLFRQGDSDGDPDSAYYLSPDKNCDECWRVGDCYADVTYYFENKWENDSFRKHYGTAAEYRKRFGL